MECTVVRPRSSVAIAPMIIDDDNDTLPAINDSLNNEHGRALVTREVSLPLWRLYGTSSSPPSLTSLSSSSSSTTATSRPSTSSSSQPQQWSLIETEIDNDTLFDGLHTLTITWQSHSRGLSGASPGARSWQELYVCTPRTLRPTTRSGSSSHVDNNDIDHRTSDHTNNNDNNNWTLMKRLHDDATNNGGVWHTTSCTLLYDDLKQCTRGTRFRLVQRYVLSKIISYHIVQYECAVIDVCMMS
jgi:hypothetical protein